MDKTISRVTSILIIVATVTLFVIMGIGLLRADQFGQGYPSQVCQPLLILNPVTSSVSGEMGLVMPLTDT
jgi:hypothetical protein